ncbi:MAG TPA: Dna2/Cas4 domain-containing protein [Methanocorpusculum sp.]|nr:Dna2/Cas4 domain-containing protein [Methanocorpusculum sp.]
MQLYLAKSQPAEFSEPRRYSAAKILSYHLGEVLDAEKIHEEFALSLPNADDEAIRILDEMISACSTVQFRCAAACDVQVSSEKYHIHGRIDRFFDDGFAIVKGGSAPPHGAYAVDRLQAFCYALCLEEMYGKEFKPSVEYLGSGTVRQITVSPDDRRSFIQTLKDVGRISRGEIPRPVRGKMCASCRFETSCKPLERPMSLFDKMHRKKN